MPDEDQKIQLPLDLVRRLLPFAEAQGIDLPLASREAPRIDLTQSVKVIAYNLGQILAAKDIYLRGDQIVTVDPDSGEVEPMTARRFTGWAEDHVAIACPRGGRTRESMSRDEAEVFLAQDIFRRQLRPLIGVHLMRLPVMRADGRLKLLPYGYDVESKIFTAKSLEYPLDWTVPQALEWLEKHGEGYPWVFPEAFAERKLRNCRSWAVHLAAMIGCYLRGCFPAGTPKPMIAYLANQQGTGKTTLAEMALVPVFGTASSTDLPARNDEKLIAELQTAANTLLPYLFFDDIGERIASTALNRFITASSHQARVMGGNTEIRTVPQMTQVFTTGIDVTPTRDLQRRTLVAELFLATDVRGRQFPIRINGRYLARRDVRANFLAAMHALVFAFETAQEAQREAGQELIRHPSPLESFEEYTDLVACIVIAAGYPDPLSPPEMVAGGRADEDDMRDFLIAVASDTAGDWDYSREDLVEEARKRDMIGNLVGAQGDPRMDANASKRFGRQLQKWRDRVLETKEEEPRRFRWGHGRNKHGARYPLEFLKGDDDKPPPAP
ncbi:MAG: hypothetical protein JSR82_24500 [Verrucomicrobia bacterium]|nr:hypothetical protein [Verrucomicrobiota bacterium]